MGLTLALVSVVLLVAVLDGLIGYVGSQCVHDGGPPTPWRDDQGCA